MENVDARFLAGMASTAILAFLGIAAGSFLTRVIHRVPLEKPLFTPNVCPECGTRLAARDAVPVASWLALRGKCRACRAPISWRYPAVELLTGLLWGIEGWRLAGMPAGWGTAGVLLAGLAFCSSLIVIAVVDWDYLIILDEISIGGALVSLVLSALLPGLHHADSAVSLASRYPELYALLGGWPAWARGLGSSLLGLAAGLVFSLGLYWFGNRLFRQRIEEAQADDPDIDSAFGPGDVKLMAYFGAFLGWRAVFSLFLIGAVTGAAGGAALRFASGDPGDAKGAAGWRRRWRTGQSFLPFGPFLALGAYCVFLAIRAG